MAKLDPIFVIVILLSNHMNRLTIFNFVLLDLCLFQLANPVQLSFWSAS